MRMMLMVVLPVALLAGCAQGFQGNDDDNGDDDSPPRVDAPITAIDAPIGAIDGRLIDAPTSVIDAPTSAIDAPTSNIDAPTGGACTTDTQCGAGMCCFGQLTCVPGQATGLPVPFNCLPD
jgi:hypothetical protein